MNRSHATLLAAACALALSACGGGERDADTVATTPAPATGAAGAPVATDPALDPPAATGTAPGDAAGAGTVAPGTTTGADTPGTPGTDTATAGEVADAMADTAGATAGDAATPTGCATEIEGNDRMQFNVSSIIVPSSCSEFTITLKHTGQLPVVAMGHNVVITSAADMAGVAADGIAAGASQDYVRPGDGRVIAATDMVGGGESASVSFSVDRIRDGSYQFFCSFPGHAALMKGTISVQ